VELTAHLRREGCRAGSIADWLHLAQRTLRHWCHSVRQLPLCVRLLGRASKRAALPVRRELLDVLNELGPGVSVAWLRDHFPEMGKRELADFLARYRKVWRWQHRQAVHVLRWTVPGRVWAMDFTELPTLIDGLYPYLLAVRDLASGQQLLALPTRHMTEETVRPALAWLFAEHGAPLVLKTDNGSAFRDGAARAFLRDHGVSSLFSPARMPRYNGAIEASIGSLKTRIEVQAMRHGRPGLWTWDDVAAAQHEANAMARPHGSGGPTPAVAWLSRPQLDATERQDFLAMLAHCHAAERTQTGQEPDADSGADREPLWSRPEQHTEDRHVVRRTLEACGDLCYARRRIQLPIPGKKAARDS
jgi:transposase InsO family protein